MTTTDNATVTLSDDSLTLVRLSLEYVNGGEAYAAGLRVLAAEVTDDTDDRLVFYAAPSSWNDNYARLIVPTGDPRSLGMTGDHYGVPVPFDRDTHLGWNVPVTSLRPVDVPKAPFAVGDRVRQSGPHYIANDRTDHEYHESPHGIGSLGTVTGVDTPYGEGMAVHVQWDVAEGERPRSSVIATDSLEHVSEDVPSPVEAPVDVEARIAEAVAEARREEQRKAEEWRERATRIAHQYADDNSLCSQFDLCMIEIGLEPRMSFTREFSVEITETRTYSVYVEATNEDDAAEMAEDRVSNGYETPHDITLEVDDVEEQ